MKYIISLLIIVLISFSTYAYEDYQDLPKKDTYFSEESSNGAQDVDQEDYDDSNDIDDTNGVSDDNSNLDEYTNENNY